MKILLTGATGFLGSHLAKRFLDDGHDVAILLRRQSNRTRIAGLLGDLKCYELESDGLEAPFRDHRALDLVVHAATLYGRHGETGLSVAEANTLFPLRILDLAHAHGVQSFINTDSFYAATSTYANLASYALSKRHFAEWGRLYADARKIRFLNVRMEHVFGPGDKESKFVNWVVKKCSESAGEIDLTEGLQERDFIFIDDVVSAFSMLVNKASCLDPGWTNMGLGSARPVTVRHFVELVHRLSCSKAELRFGAIPYSADEIMRSCADNAVLKSMGWSPAFDLEAALKLMISHEVGSTFSSKTQER